MKIHISNLYNFNRNDLIVKKHHQFAEAGRSLGFLEMGIFDYPVETDSVSELSKRLDGMIASLESEDVVFLQLPTKNGIDFEKKLAGKIKAYRNTKLIMILHNNLMEDTVSSEYIELYRIADGLITFSKSEMVILKNQGMHQVVCAEDVLYAKNTDECIEQLNGVGNGYLSLCRNDFQIKRLLMNSLDSIFYLEKMLLKNNETEREEEIQIGFGLYDKTGNYSVWVGVAMQSIIEHTNGKICFHILHDDTLSYINKSKLTLVGTTKGNRICFHKIKSCQFKEFSKLMGNYTIGAMFRIVIPEILIDLEKIIYLDADVLVNRDIEELWSMDIRDYYMAVVPDIDVVKGIVKPYPVKKKLVNPERYFNSGVIYMNLVNIRKKGSMKEEILACLKAENNWELPDQDALNIIYGEKILLLDTSWNYFARTVRYTEEKELKKKIYHYVGTKCLLYFDTGMDYLYYETVARTPWKEDAKQILHHSVKRTKERVEQLESIMKVLADGKIKCIFYGNETRAMQKMYKLVGVKKEDYRILDMPESQDQEMLACKEFSYLQMEKDKYIVFVLPDADNWTAIGRLDALGLKRGEDYFVIPVILSPRDGGYI